MKIRKVMTAVLLLALVMCLGCMSVVAWATEAATLTVGEGGFDTLEAALTEVETGDTIVLAKAIDATGVTLTLPEGVTLQGMDAENPVTVTNMSGIAASSSELTFKNIKFANTTAKFTMRGSDITFENCTFTGSGSLTTIESGTNFTFSSCIFDGGYKQIDSPTVTNLTISNCISRNSGFSFIYYGNLSGDVRVTSSEITSYAYTVHTGNGGTAGTRYEISNTVLDGWTSYGGEVESATFTNCTFNSSGSYHFIRPYRNTTFVGCEFASGFDPVGSGSADLTFKFKDCTKAGVPLTKDNFDTALGLSDDTSNDHSDTLTVIVNDVKRIGGTGTWLDPVAQIEDEYYYSLAGAIAAVPTDGTKTTITMVADETINVVGSAITIPASKNVVLDLNGHEVVGTADGGSTSALITNNGTLTIQDSSSNKSGKLISGATTTWVHDGGDDYSGSYASNAITNSGILTVKSGTVKNLSSGSATYAVDNNSSGADAILNVEGGTLEAVSVAVRMFANNTAKENKVNVSGGTITANYSGIWVQLPGSDAAKAMKATLNVTGGTLRGSNYAFYDYSYGNSFDNTQYNLSGGTFSGTVFSFGANFEITGGAYTSDVAIKQTNASDVSVSGGNFAGDVYTYGDKASEGFITGGYFASEPDTAYIAPGYKIVQIPDTASEYAGWYTVGEIKTESTETITTGKDIYTVTTNVVSGKGNDAVVLDSSETSVSVASITEEAITQEAAKTTDTVSLANIDTKNVAEAAAAQVAADNVEGANTIEVTVSLSKAADGSTDLIAENETGEVFEVHPVATYVVKDVNGNEIQNAGGTFPVDNNDLEGSFTFKLYLDSNKFDVGDLVTVIHYGTQTETWTKKVQSDSNGLYVELTLSSFSHIAVKANSDPNATVDYTVRVGDADAGAAYYYVGYLISVDVTVSGDDFYSGDFTIGYDSTNFEFVSHALADGLTRQNSKYTFADSTNGGVTTKYLNYNLTKDDNTRFQDGSKVLTLTFRPKTTIEGTVSDYYTLYTDFVKVTQAYVTYSLAEGATADQVKAENLSGDSVKIYKTLTVSFNVDDSVSSYEVPYGKKLSNIVVDPAKTGYAFKGWNTSKTATDGTAFASLPEVTTSVVTEPTYYAIFAPETYDVTVNGVAASNATYKTAYVFNIPDYDGDNYDYAVTYTVGNGASKTLASSNISGNAVTIPAEDVTGALAITVTPTLKEDSFEVELHADYVTGYTLVLVRRAAGNASLLPYTLKVNTDGAVADNGTATTMYKINNGAIVTGYDCYGYLVSGSTTVSAVKAALAIGSGGEAVTVSYNVTNNTGSPAVDHNDVQNAYLGYKVKLTTVQSFMMQYLRADVNGDYKLDTTDVGLINSNRDV